MPIPSITPPSRNEGKMSVRTRRNSKIEKTEVVEVAENTEEVMDEDYVKCAECGDLLSSKIEDEDVERETNNNLECEVCVRWFHAQCVSVSEANYLLLVQNDFHWFCPNCDAAAKHLYRSVTAMKAENMKLKQDLSKLSTRVTTVETSLTKKITDTKNQLKGELKNDLKNDFNKIKADMKTESLNNITTLVTEEREKLKTELKAEILGELQQSGDDNQPLYADAAAATRVTVRQELEMLNPTRQAVREEIEERQRIMDRKNNLMILNLAEPTNGTPAEEDVRCINEIINNRLDVQVTVSNATRLGTYNVTKRRPVRVTLTNLDDKKKILKKAANLRNLQEADTYCKVYIRPDLTTKQLEASKNLYEMLKKKRLDHPEKQWKIFRDKIIEIEAGH